MSENASKLLTLVVLTATCVFPFCGCGSEAPSQADAQLRAAMTLLGREYGAYMAATGTSPPDEPAFRKYLQSRMVVLGDFGVKSVDDLLRLGRDGQPFRLIYGTKRTLPERPEYVWVAHEQIGVAGMRLACDSRGGVYEISDIEYTQQIASK